MGGMVALRFLLLSLFVTLIFGQGITESGMNYFGLFQGVIPKVINPKLSYYGGPVIPSVEVVNVKWGAPTLPNATHPRSYITQLRNGLMEKWYKSIVNSVYIDWLSEYKTQTQNISRGTWKGNYTIIPSINSSLVTDAQVQAELKKQLDAKQLPLPNAFGTMGKVKTVYMIHFPNEVQVSWTLGITCLTICGYHGSFVYGNKYVPYAVIPSMGGDLCPKGCGKAANLYQNTQIVASHELLESITDTRMMEAIPFALPLLTHTPKRVSWYDLANGEIADICLGQFGQIQHPTGGALTVQKQWSNSDKACIMSRDFIISATTTTLALTRNNVAVHVNLIINQLGGSTQLIQLKAGTRPANVTAVFSRNNFNSGTAIMTVKAGSGAPLGGSQIMRIQAIGKNYIKRITFDLVITPA